MGNLDRLQIRIDLGNLPADMAGNVPRAVRRIGLASAKQQPPVTALAEVADHKPAVGHGLRAAEHLREAVERFRCSDEGPDRHHMGCRNRLKIADIGIGRDQQTVGSDRALRRVDDGLATSLADRACRRHLVDASPGGRRDLRQTNKQLQRMDMPGACIANAEVIAGGAHTIMRFLPVHEGDMRIAVAHRHDLGLVPVVGFAVALVRDIHLPGQIFDVYAVLFGKIEQVMLGILRQIEQRLGTLEAKLGLQLSRPSPLAGAELAAIAP